MTRATDTPYSPSSASTASCPPLYHSKPLSFFGQHSVYKKNFALHVRRSDSLYPSRRCLGVRVNGGKNRLIRLA